MLITPVQVYSYFSENFDLKQSSKGWFIFDCPMCANGAGKRKMAVQPHYGVVKCWACEYRGYVSKFISDYDGIQYSQAVSRLQDYSTTGIIIPESNSISAKRAEDIFTNSIQLPVGFKSILEGSGTLGKRARAILTDRGFDIEELEYEGFGYCNEHADNDEDDYFGYIIIPFKVNGKLVYYQGRDFIGNFLRYKNPSKESIGIGKGDLLYNQDAVRISSDLKIVEGWADAKTLGPDGVATSGWKLSDIQHDSIMTSTADILTFIPDAGSDGTGELFYIKAVKIAMDFIAEKHVRVVNLNGVVDEGKDVNELGKAFINKQIAKTDYLDFETAFKVISGL